MDLEVRALGEGPAADGAGERLSARVDHRVARDVARVSGRVAADATQVPRQRPHRRIFP